MREYDVIVVGAGPGGSSAAYFLARAGARVAVVERKEFPRAKTCGDGLTPRAVKVLAEMGLEAEMSRSQKVRGLRVIAAGRTLEMDWPDLSNFPGIGLVRPRKDLDAAIAERAQAVGADFLMKTEAASPFFEEGAVSGIRWAHKEKARGGGVVNVDEGVLRAPFTIVADGASSPFGRAMGIRKRADYPMGLAIRTYYRSDRARDEMLESWLELRRNGDLLPGYGWIFPVGDDTVNIGVGLLNTFGAWREVNLAYLQRSYIEMLPRSYGITHESQTEPYQSGRLPMGGSVEKPYGPGYLVIGDAAGMVNPFNGEGIAYALETGKLAASILVAALSAGNHNELSEYRQALHDTYGAYYRFGRRFVRIISNPLAFRLICQLGMRSQTVMKFVLQVLANLAEAKGGGLGDRGFRALVRLAEFDLPDLKDPEVPEVSAISEPRPKKAGVA